MAMTITEAGAVNRLLDWITRNADRPVTDEEALRHAQTLAESAHKKLMAGWFAHQLPAVWPRTAAAEISQPTAERLALAIRGALTQMREAIEDTLDGDEQASGLHTLDLACDRFDELEQQLGTDVL